MECSGLCAIVANFNLIVHFGERLEIAYYYILKSGREPVSNRVVEGTLKQKMCLIFNSIVRAKVA